METILLLAHVEAGGSLAKSAREALHAARALNKAIAGSNLVRRAGRRKRPSGGGFHRRLSGHKVFRRGRRGVWPVALCHGRGGGRSPLQSGAGHPGRRSGNFALEPRFARRRATAAADAWIPMSPASATPAASPRSAAGIYRQRMEATLTRDAAAVVYAH